MSHCLLMYGRCFGFMFYISYKYLKNLFLEILVDHVTAICSKIKNRFNSIDLYLFIINKILVN